MKVIADLHIHSKYSRACSKDLDIDNLEKYARIKGLSLLGTGDFCHPKWILELKEKLKDDGNGILRTKTGFPFILQNEISLIYSQDGKGRRVHFIILAPSFDVVEQITEALGKRGRLDYDGRPIFNMPSFELVEMMNNISKDIELIPAHAWTPWFSVFGSNSGFDSLKDCFQDKIKHIHALETGLSSNPEMNWRISELDDYSLVSFSDCHSFWPWRIGREATIFDISLSYKSLINAIRTKEGLVETIEVQPSYGKYHLDGHRDCGICFEPEESSSHNNLCPKCGRQLTIGVLNRVEKLADRPAGFIPKNSRPFKSLIPLSEVMSKLLGSGIATKAVWFQYNKLIEAFGPEFSVLMEAKEENIAKVVDPKIARAIILNREGKIIIRPGYDGVYGEPVFDFKVNKQKDLKGFF